MLPRAAPLAAHTADRHACERATDPNTTDKRLCPVRALQAWLDATGIQRGPLLRRVTPSNRAGPGRMNPESINYLTQQAIRRAGITGGPWSAHSLRAGFDATGDTVTSVAGAGGGHHLPPH